MVFAGRAWRRDCRTCIEKMSASTRDALVVASAANPNGLIGASGRIGQKHQISELMDSLAPRYGDDRWFLAYHAMALSEDGQLATARPKIERSLAVYPNNAHGAHGFAHVCYESSEPDTARDFLADWLGHVSARWLLPWSSELASLALRTTGRELGGASQLSRDAMVLDRHSGGPQRECRMRRPFCGGPNSPVSRATPTPGARCTGMPTTRCRSRAAGSPTYTSFWRRPSSAMTTRPGSCYPDRGTWRARGAILPALTFPVARGFAAFERGDYRRLSRRSPPLGRGKRTHRRQPRAARPDRVHFAESVSRCWPVEEARRLWSKPGGLALPAFPSRELRWSADWPVGNSCTQPQRLTSKAGSNESRSQTGSIHGRAPSRTPRCRDRRRVWYWTGAYAKPTPREGARLIVLDVNLDGANKTVDLVTKKQAAWRRQCCWT